MAKTKSAATTNATAPEKIREPIPIDPGQPYAIGGLYQIRTVTMTVTGKVEAVGAQEIVLSSAAWIADTGRFAGAVEKAEYNEVEPFPDDRLVIVGRAAVIDAVTIPSLPRTQK